jgi:hypothetical protein
VSSVTRRSQQQKIAAEKAAAAAAAANETDPAIAPDHNRKKVREPFKGKSDKMAGHVFQLSVEGRKATQFLETIKAFRDFANVELDNPQDLAPWFGDPCADVTLNEPPDEPPMSTDGTNRVGTHHRLYIKWKGQCEQFDQKERNLANNKVKIFTMLLQQCSPSVTNKVEASTGYESASKEYKVKWLIKTIKNVCHNFEQTENRFVALVKAKAEQSANQSTPDYRDAFKEYLSVLESYGGKVHDPITAVPTAFVNPTYVALTSDEQDALVLDHYVAALFIRNADDARYRQLRNDLSNSFVLGREEYPTSLADAFPLLQAQRGTSAPTSDRFSRNSNRGKGRGETGCGNGRGYQGQGRGRGNGRGSGTTPPATIGGSNLLQIAAPPDSQTGLLFTQLGSTTGNTVCLAQSHDELPDGIPNHFVLLDSNSTISIFNNPTMLNDIHDVKTPLVLQVQWRRTLHNTPHGFHQGFWQGLVPSQIHRPHSLPRPSAQNLLCHHGLQRRHRFPRPPLGWERLHPFQRAHIGPLSIRHNRRETPYASATTNTNDAIIGYSYLQTVADNKKVFTKRQIDAADAARLLYRKLGRPGAARFLDIIRKNLLINCPVTTDNVNRAERIYGKDVAFLKGKDHSQSH